MVSSLTSVTRISRVVIVLCLCLRGGSVRAQNWENNGPYYSAIQELVASPDSPFGAWVIEEGDLQHTDSGGQTWVVRENGLPDDLFEYGPLIVHPADGDTLLRCDPTLEFYRTFNRGLVWENVPFEPLDYESYIWLDVNPSSGLPYLVTSKSILEFHSWSADPERTFLVDEYPELDYINGVIPHPTDPTIYIISTSEFVLRVHTDSNSYEEIYSPWNTGMFVKLDPTVPTGTASWLIGWGQSGIADDPWFRIESTDGGESWQEGMTFPGAYSWLETSGRLWAAGHNGLLFSDDHTVTWDTLITSAQLPVPYETLTFSRTAVSPMDSTIVWFAPFSQGFYVTQSGGNSWEWIESLQRPADPSRIVPSHSDPSIVFASLGNMLWSSQDQGSSWELRSVSPDQIHRLLLSADDETLFRATTWSFGPISQGSQFARSNDGGWTWEWRSDFVIDGTDYLLVNATIHPTGSDTVFALLAEDTWQHHTSLYRSEDFGESWEQAAGVPTASEAGGYVNVDPYHPERVFVGFDDILYRSLDYGHSFVQLPELVAVFFRPNSRQLIGLTTTTLQISSDEGDTWQALSPPPGGGDFIWVSHLHGTEQGLIIAREEGVWASWQNDYNWQPVQLPFVGDLTGGIALASDQTVYVSHEGVWIGRNPVFVTEVRPPEHYDPDVRVFPNPFNRNATLHYLLTDPATVTIQVHDLLGRLTLSYPPQKQNQGKQSLPLYLRDQSSGTYFVSVNVNGIHLATKKLVLIR